jgi:hypothetical protein
MALVWTFCNTSYEHISRASNYIVGNTSPVIGIYRFYQVLHSSNANLMISYLPGRHVSVCHGNPSTKKCQHKTDWHF